MLHKLILSLMGFEKVDFEELIGYKKTGYKSG